LLGSLKYMGTPVDEILKSLDPDILALHALVHVLVPGLVAVAEDIVAVAGNTAAAVQQKAAETSNRHLEQRLLLQVTYYTAVAVDLRSFVGAAAERSSCHLEQTQMLQMACTTVAFAEEGTVAAFEGVGIARQ
jgi:hypothetical protein